MKELDELEAARSRKVLLGVSGGIASAVAGALLKNQGFEVVGIFLEIESERDGDQEFVASHMRCAATDFKSASAICKRLDIPLTKMDVKGLFEDRVLDRFVHERLQGGQGSPCLHCHLEVKLRPLFAKADELGIRSVATGHYAQIIQNVASGGVQIHKAADPSVDQSWLLYRLEQEKLKRLMLPLGGIPYSMVAKLAAEFDLNQGSSPQVRDGGCLRGASALADFIEGRVAPSLRPSGTIKTTEGSSIGEHEGLHRFEVGAKPTTSLVVNDQDKLVVLQIDPLENSVRVGGPEFLPKGRFAAGDTNWLHPVDHIHDLICEVRIEGGSGEIRCRVTHFEHQIIHVELDQPSSGVSVGKSVVFYSGGELLGGATIVQVSPGDPADGSV